MRGTVESILILAVVVFLGQLIYLRVFARTPQEEVKEAVVSDNPVNDFLDNYS